MDGGLSESWTSQSSPALTSLLFDEPLHLFRGSAVSPVCQEVLNELVDLDGVLETD